MCVYEFMFMCGLVLYFHYISWLIMGSWKLYCCLIRGERFNLYIDTCVLNFGFILVCITIYIDWFVQSTCFWFFATFLNEFWYQGVCFVGSLFWRCNWGRRVWSFILIHFFFFGILGLYVHMYVFLDEIWVHRNFSCCSLLKGQWNSLMDMISLEYGLISFSFSWWTQIFENLIMNDSQI